MMYEDEVCEGLVQETPRGFMTLIDDVPSALFKFIVGKGGETKRRIEEDTNTRISIPGVDQEGNISKQLKVVKFLFCWVGNSTVSRIKKG